MKIFLRPFDFLRKVIYLPPLWKQSLQKNVKWPVRLGVRTPGFHPGNTGSNPVRAAKTLLLNDLSFKTRGFFSLISRIHVFRFGFSTQFRVGEHLGLSNKLFKTNVQYFVPLFDYLTISWHLTPFPNSNFSCKIHNTQVPFFFKIEFCKHLFLK